MIVLRQRQVTVARDDREDPTLGRKVYEIVLSLPGLSLTELQNAVPVALADAGWRHGRVDTLVDEFVEFNGAKRRLLEALADAIAYPKSDMTDREVESVAVALLRISSDLEPIAKCFDWNDELESDDDYVVEYLNDWIAEARRMAAARSVGP